MQPRRATQRIRGAPRRHISNTALLLAALVTCLSSIAARAATPASTSTDAELSTVALGVQRAIFRSTMNEVQRGARTNIDSARASLAHYPLLPYLEYALLQRALPSATAADVGRFVSLYRDSPLAPQLRSAWLRSAAQAGAWTDFQTLYDPATADTGLRCSAYEARFRGGQPAIAIKEMALLWSSAKPLPASCNAIVAAWIDAGGVTQNLAEQRLDAAVAANAMTLARDTVRYLPTGAAALALQLLAVHDSPDRVLSLAPEDSARGRRVLAHGIERLSRRDVVAAEAQWQRLRARYHFDASDQKLVLVALIRGALEQGKARQPEPIPELADGSHAQVIELVIRDAITRGRWQQLAIALRAVPSFKNPEVRWRYWQARATELSGVNSTAAVGAAASTAVRGPKVRDLYASVALDRSYYGFLAADRLQQRPSLNPRIRVPDMAQVNAMQQHIAVRRTFELVALGRNEDAKAEWKYLSQHLTPPQVLAAGAAAGRVGLYRLCIQTVIDGGTWDALELRFPTAFADIMFPAAAAQGIDPSWVYGITRQESLFDSNARSPVGALGLMQLMPGTAELTARSAGIPLAGAQQVLRPELNVKLGARYLAQMYQTFGFHRALASAGYNAGPGRVRAWLRLRPASPIDVWIELIPFKETRQYVQNVLLYSHIYSRLLGTHQPFLFDHER